MRKWDMLIKHRTPSPSENAGRVATKLRNIIYNNREAIGANFREYMLSGSKSCIVGENIAAVCLWPDYLVSGQVVSALQSHMINWSNCKKW